MNIYFLQVEKRSQLFSYLLAAFAICMVLMLVLSFNQSFANRWAMPSASSQVVRAESNNVPVPIPAPQPPAEQLQLANASVPADGENPVPQVIAIPVPSVP